LSGLGIAGDAMPLLTGFAALALLLFILGSWIGRWRVWLIGYAAAVIALALAFFFRDPARAGERGPDLFLAPADGRVVEVERISDPGNVGREAVLVAIYLGLLDVHVQRSPVAGVVDFVDHRPGGFAPAWSERAGHNEAATIGVDTGEGRVLVRQVAGTVARRIVTYVEEGEIVEQGDRIGLIRFGSRVEAYLPSDARVLVRPGDRVQAGTTVIARTPTPATGRAP
jgi:phosphatidylserine decarboxylase